MSRYIDADNLVDAKILGISTRYVAGWNDAIDAIRECEPTADVRENVHGEWHHISSTGWECSACGRVVTMRPIDKKKTLYNFCPNCGADMRKGETNG